MELGAGPGDLAAGSGLYPETPVSPGRSLSGYPRLWTGREPRLWLLIPGSEEKRLKALSVALNKA